MVDWIKIRDKNGNETLVNSDEVAYIDENGIVFRGGMYIPISIDVEDAERAIVESRKTGERWLNGERI